MRHSSRRWFRQFASRDVERVQNVQISITGASSASVTPSPAVDWTRTVIVIRGFYSTLGSVDIRELLAYIDVNGADVRATAGISVTATTHVFLQLVTYRPGVIKRIQRGTVTAAGTGTADANLSNAVDRDKAELHALGFNTDSNSLNTTTGDIRWVDDDTVQYARGTSSNTSTIGFQVVEKY